MKPPKGAETIEMVDGRIFFSRDNWQTTYVIKPGSDRARKVPRRQADLVRFLAVSQSSWAGDAG
jgi:hypothetical protein